MKTRVLGDNIKWLSHTEKYLFKIFIYNCGIKTWEVSPEKRTVNVGIFPNTLSIHNLYNPVKINLLA